MGDFVTQFFTMPTLAFVIGVSVIVLFIRKVVEKVWKGGSTNVWWAEIALPTLPMAVAVLIAMFAKKYPYPEIFAGSYSARIFYGLVCGAFADLIYGKIKKVITAFGGSDAASATMTVKRTSIPPVANIVDKPSEEPAPPTSPTG
jgi:hypothetical protein